MIEAIWIPRNRAVKLLGKLEEVERERKCFGAGEEMNARASANAH